MARVYESKPLPASAPQGAERSRRTVKVYDRPERSPMVKVAIYGIGLIVAIILVAIMFF